MPVVLAASSATFCGARQLNNGPEESVLFAHDGLSAGLKKALLGLVKCSVYLQAAANAEDQRRHGIRHWALQLDIWMLVAF